MTLHLRVPHYPRTNAVLEALSGELERAPSRLLSGRSSSGLSDLKGTLRTVLIGSIREVTERWSLGEAMVGPAEPSTAGVIYGSGGRLVPGHRLTREENARGGRVAQQRRREERERLEQKIAEQVAKRMLNELMASVETYIAIRDDPKAPESARIAAADRIVDRILGKVGERITVARQEQRELHVRVETQQAVKLIQELKQLGVLDR